MPSGVGLPLPVGLPLGADVQLRVDKEVPCLTPSPTVNAPLTREQWLELQLAKAPALTDARCRRLAFLLSPTTKVA